MITPNQGEFEAVAGACDSDEELARRGWEMVRELDLTALLVTRSEKGMMLLETGSEPVFLHTQAREVYDVTGAGDTVIADPGGCAGQWSGAWPKRRHWRMLRPGWSYARLASLRSLPEKSRWRSTSAARVVEDSFRARNSRCLSARRAGRNERIVMTNGCFDILHAGHVAYLEEAKSLGDRLVVAVNDDESVKRLKGESRPINGLDDRMLVLAGLAAVDWVVPFHEDTPADLIDNVLPDVLVKGGDYEPDEIAGGKAVLANGGEVRVLSFRDGHSTTRIIDRLRG